MHPHTHSWLNDAMLFFGGSTALGIVGHIVSTFPTPQNKYGQWVLSSVQYIVGQRLQAQQTVAGQANVNMLAKEALSPPAKLEVIAEPVKPV